MARRILTDLSPLFWCHLMSRACIPCQLLLCSMLSLQCILLLPLIQLHNYVDFITLLHKYSSIRTTFMSVIIHISRSRVVYIVKQCIES